MYVCTQKKLQIGDSSDTRDYTIVLDCFGHCFL